MTSLFVNNVQLRVTVKRTVVRSVPTSSGEHTVGNATFAERKATINAGEVGSPEFEGFTCGIPKSGDSDYGFRR